MIGERLGHASELRKHPQDVQFSPHLPSVGYSRRFARQPRFSFKIMTDRG